MLSFSLSFILHGFTQPIQLHLSKHESAFAAETVLCFASIDGFLAPVHLQGPVGVHL